MTVKIEKAETTDPVSRLTRWIERKPESADTLRLVVEMLAKQDLVLEYSSEEVDRLGAGAVAQGMFEECEIWAETKAKIVPFKAQWIADNREVSSRPFKVIPDSLNGVGQTGLPPIDGTAESWLASLQAASLRKDQILITQMEAVAGLFLQLVEHQQQRISWLEGQELEARKLREDMIELTRGDQESEARFARLMSVLEKGLQAKGLIAQAAQGMGAPHPRKTPGQP